MNFRAEQQKRCAVFMMDDISEHESEPLEKLPCYLEHCSVVAELCVDGVIKILGGSCTTLNQGSASTGRFTGPSDAYL